MSVVVLEVVRTGVVLGVFLFLWAAGRSRADLSRRGWRTILGGVLLLLMGSALAVTRHYPALARFEVLGPTDAREFLQQIVGYAGGLVLLAVGVARWIPAVTRVGEIESLNRDLSQANQELRAAEEALQSRDGILNAVAHAVEGFLRTGSWTDSVDDILQRLGRASGAGRVYIFESQPTGASPISISQRHEWVGPVATPQAVSPVLQDFSLRCGVFGRWTVALGRGETIHGNASGFPSGERAALESQGVRSLVVAPIFVGVEWWGFIGFEDCARERDWSEGELQAFRTAARSLGAAIWRKRAEEELERHSEVLEERVQERTRRLEELADMLRLRDHRQRALLNNIPDMAWLKDRQGRFIAVNEAYAAASGLSPEDIVGRADADIWPARLAAAYRADDEEVMLSGARKRVEEPLTDRAGRDKWLETIKTPIHDDRGQVIGTAGIARDITERKRVEAERLLLATAVEQAAESTVIADPSGVIQYVNPAFERITGYPRAEAVGRDAADILGGPHPDALPAEAWGRIRQGEAWRGQATQRRKDGAPYRTETAISPVRDAEGRIVNLVCVWRDVSKEVELEGRLRQAEKMEAIGTLAGGIAHDFNNTLFAILGFAELAQADAGAGTRLHRCLQQVLDAARRGSDLVRQILTFSRRAEPERKPVRLQAVVRESLQLLRGSLPSTILIEEDIAEDCGPVSADPTQMHQVVINLCANASHAMRERGGVLRVALRDVEVDADLASKHPDLRPGPHARLTVADTGCGMDAATLARIFEPYFTTKPVGEGTGLGLATVHGIVRSHRGAILVESQVGRGSAFDVYLPHSAVGSPRPDGGEAAGEPLRGTERIMFVDDERPIVQLGQMALEGLGYKVTAFAGGAEALEALRADPSAFDLLITDQTMPNVTGMELAREARRLRPDLPVILCTGFSEAVDEAHPERMGCSACLRKPLSKRDLGQAIRRALDARRRA